MSWKRRPDGIPQIVVADEEREEFKEAFSTEFHRLVSELAKLIDTEVTTKFDSGIISEEELNAIQWVRFSNLAELVDLLVIGEDLSKLEAITKEIRDLQDSLVLINLMDTPNNKD